MSPVADRSVVLPTLTFSAGISVAKVTARAFALACGPITGGSLALKAASVDSVAPPMEGVDYW